MILLITGGSHTGKTLLAQRVLEKYKFPYLSIDHLKMGLIRSGYTLLAPEEDGALTEYLWPVVREMIKTAIENRQDLVVEGFYIPFGWEKDFAPGYMAEIRYVCLIMGRRYIESHFAEVLAHGSDIEHRREDGITRQEMLRDNRRNLELSLEGGYPYLLIREKYGVPLDLSAPQTVLRRYRPTDCEKLADLFYNTVHLVNCRDYTPRQLAVWATGQVDLEKWDRSFREHETLVALRSGEIVGFGDMDSAGYLDRLYVHWNCQGCGVATAICDTLEELAEADHFSTHASITARPFFEKRGYRVLKEQQVFRDGVALTNFVMEKKS